MQDTANSSAGNSVSRRLPDQAKHRLTAIKRHVRSISPRMVIVRNGGEGKMFNSTVWKSPSKGNAQNVAKTTAHEKIALIVAAFKAAIIISPSVTGRTIRKCNSVLTGDTP